MRKMGVLFAAFEAVPFMKTGGLGDVAGSLPQALSKENCDVRVIIPKFGAIPQQYKDQMRYVCHFYVPLGWRAQYCGIEMLEHKGVIYYFVDNEYYFNRGGAYGYFDDGERIAFFAKSVVECIQYLPDFHCDILHANDWHTALSPVFLREFYRGIEKYDNIKTVFTVHNLKFQGQMSDRVLPDILGLSHIPAAESQLRCDRDSVNFMKGALCYSDILTTVSRTYAEEIQRPFFGEHMDEIFRRRSALSGASKALFFLLAVIGAAGSVGLFFFFTNYNVARYFFVSTQTETLSALLSSGSPALIAKSLFLSSSSRTCRGERFCCAAIFLMLLAGTAVYEANIILYSPHQLHRMMLAITLSYGLLLIELGGWESTANDLLLVAVMVFLFIHGPNNFRLPQEDSRTLTAQAEEELMLEFRSILPLEDDPWDNTIAKMPDNGGLQWEFMLPTYTSLNVCQDEVLEKLLKDGTLRSRFVILSDSSELNKLCVDRGYRVVWQGYERTMYQTRE